MPGAGSRGCAHTDVYVCTSAWAVLTGCAELGMIERGKIVCVCMFECVRIRECVAAAWLGVLCACTSLSVFSAQTCDDTWTCVPWRVCL